MPSPVIIQLKGLLKKQFKGLLKGLHFFKKNVVQKGIGGKGTLQSGCGKGQFKPSLVFMTRQHADISEFGQVDMGKGGPSGNQDSIHLGHLRLKLAP